GFRPPGARSAAGSAPRLPLAPCRRLAGGGRARSRRFRCDGAALARASYRPRGIRQCRLSGRNCGGLPGQLCFRRDHVLSDALSAAHPRLRSGQDRPLLHRLQHPFHARGSRLWKDCAHRRRQARDGGRNAVLAVSFLLLAAIRPASGFGLVLAGLIVSGIGQGLAFNLSTTAAMSSIAEEKAGAASGILTAIRIVGVAVGVAATGVLVRNLENDKATALVTAARGSLSPDAKADLGRLLSGSPEAAAALAKLAPTVAEHVKEIVRTSFDAGFTAGMLLCLAVSILATAVAVLIKERPRVAHA